MRLLVTASIILMCSIPILAADGPIDKGSLVFGGTIAFANTSGDGYEIDDEPVSAAFVAPVIGGFVSSGVMLGGQLTYARLSLGPDDYSAWALGPTLGYFFNTVRTDGKTRGSFYPYVKAFFMVGKGDSGSDYTLSSLGGQAGIDVMLSNTLAIDFGLRIQRDTWNADGKGKSYSGTIILGGLGLVGFCW